MKKKTVRTREAATAKKSPLESASSLTRSPHSPRCTHYAPTPSRPTNGPAPSKTDDLGTTKNTTTHSHSTQSTPGAAGCAGSGTQRTAPSHRTQRTLGRIRPHKWHSWRRSGVRRPLRRRVVAGNSMRGRERGGRLVGAGHASAEADDGRPRRGRPRPRPRASAFETEDEADFARDRGEERRAKAKVVGETRAHGGEGGRGGPAQAGSEGGEGGNKGGLLVYADCTRLAAGGRKQMRARRGGVRSRKGFGGGKRGGQQTGGWVDRCGRGAPGRRVCFACAPCSVISFPGVARRRGRKKGNKSAPDCHSSILSPTLHPANVPRHTACPALLARRRRGGLAESKEERRSAREFRKQAAAHIPRSCWARARLRGREREGRTGGDRPQRGDVARIGARRDDRGKSRARAGAVMRRMSRTESGPPRPTVKAGEPSTQSPAAAQRTARCGRSQGPIEAMGVLVLFVEGMKD
ncbi:hypothetical protein DFH06DRAFT_1369688 [Mycena polygramma]|nr:hypothetical protein DFH06DRAFT_1369688 [Mycena polygramma]